MKFQSSFWRFYIWKRLLKHGFWLLGSKKYGIFHQGSYTLGNSKLRVCWDRNLFPIRKFCRWDEQVFLWHILYKLMPTLWIFLTFFLSLFILPLFVPFFLFFLAVFWEFFIHIYLSASSIWIIYYISDVVSDPSKAL